MMTMRVFGANQSAWQYLANTVAIDEYGQDRGIEMASYYMAEGTPPGQWVGSGLTGAHLSEETEVNAVLLEKIFGLGIDPLTNSPLGETFIESKTLEQRVQDRLFGADFNDREKQLLKLVNNEGGFTGDESEQQEFLQVLEKADQIYEEEKAKPQKESVAGFEMVFSPPKSVSSWWAIADPNLKDEIRNAHKEAIQATINMLEADVIKTRIGEAGIAQAEVKGIVASLFDHWDSREGDPQLHTHMLVSNKVQTLDGKWRTIDSRTLFYNVASASMVYDTALMDTLSSKLGVEWTTQDVLEQPEKYRQWRKEKAIPDSPAARHQFSLDLGVSVGSVKWQIHDIPQKLNREYSTRSTRLNDATDEFINDYQEKHGRRPSDSLIIKIRQNATVRTRTGKRLLSLKALTSNWRERAQPIVGDTFYAADRIKAKGVKRLKQYSLWTYRNDDLDASDVQAVVNFSLATLNDLSTWRRSNAETVVMRATAHWRFRSAADRRLATKRITEAVVAAAIPITPKNHLHTPFRFQLPDDATVFQPKSHDLFTTKEIWEAEERIIMAGRNTESLTIATETIDALISTPTGTEERILSDDQAAAVTTLLSSGRLMDILVGPAGAGKTTSLEKLREIWETQYGAGSVRGLAPTARAAEVLAESLGIETENTAKWIYETTKPSTERNLQPVDVESDFNFSLTAGDLLIVDEASIAGTVALDNLRGQAEAAGAKLLLVGDWAQLAAVDAGGAFGLLAGDRKDVAELTSLHRFKEQWEAEASKLLRIGRTAALDAYIENDRLHHGLDESIVDRAVTAWKKDEAAVNEQGEQFVSLLIAPTNEMVERLNQLARDWRIEQGQVKTGKEATIASGLAGVGDRIVTRQNARTIRTDKDRWVKNNDEWIVKRVTSNGSIIAVSGDEEVILPAKYIADHVQLAYATTAHRSQGRTVDTAHTIVDSSASRETFYVAMTRGKLENHAYVIEDEDNLLGDSSGLGMRRTWRETLDAVLTNRSGGVSAHNTLDFEAQRLGSIKQLAAEYQTIASDHLSKTYVPLLTNLKVLNAEAPDSPYLGPVMANLRRLELLNVDPKQIIQKAINERSLSDANNPLAVLHYRLGQELEDIAEVEHYRDKFGPLLSTFNINVDELEVSSELKLFYRAVDAAHTTGPDKVGETLRDAISNARSNALNRDNKQAAAPMAMSQQMTNKEMTSQVLKVAAFNVLREIEVEVKDLQPTPINTNTNLIAGIVEPAPNIDDDDTSTALKDREFAIRLRAEMVLDKAIENNEPWIKDLGVPAIGAETQWRNNAVTVACYRDLYGVESATAVDRGLLKQRNRVRDRRIAAAQLPKTQPTFLPPIRKTTTQEQTQTVSSGPKL